MFETINPNNTVFKSADKGCPSNNSILSYFLLVLPTQLGYYQPEIETLVPSFAFVLKWLKLATLSSTHAVGNNMLLIIHVFLFCKRVGACAHKPLPL